MFNFSMVLIIVLVLNGCATSSKNSSVTVQEKPVKMDKLQKYAKKVGCKMLKNGYMVCPKVMKR